MGRKRTNGEGSISYREGHSKPWLARTSRSNGRKAQSKFFSTKIEASAWLRDVNSSIDAGTRINPSKLTLSEWIGKWLITYVKPTVRLRTFEGYSDINRLHIDPIIGDIPLQALTPADLQNLLNKKAEAGLSRRTLVYILSTIRPALKQAMLDGLTTRNIADAVKVPKGTVKPKPKHALTREEIQAIQNAIEDSRFSIVFRTLAGTGTRIGELLGLSWEDIDFINSKVHIKKAVTQSRTQGQVLGQPKTDSSLRSIPIAPSLVEALKAWKGQQASEKLAAGKQWKGEDAVFTMETGSRVRREWISTQLKDVTELLNISCTPHILRHSYASLLIQSGVDPKTVQRLLGHSSPRTVMEIYAHSSDDLQRQAVKLLGF